MEGSQCDEPAAEREDSTTVSDAACQSCRKRKLRCSKELPSCSHCRRLETDCVYDYKKNKPGIKTGAVESLSRRVEALEKTLSQQQQQQQQQQSGSETFSSQSIHDVVAVLARELQKINNTGSPSLQGNAPSPASSSQKPSSRSNWYSASGSQDGRGRKRRRTESSVDITISDDLVDENTQLPPPHVMDAVIHAFFTILRPWIPMLHQDLFETGIQDPHQRGKFTVVLHAMVTGALRFVSEDILATLPDTLENYVRRSRNTVVLTAMDSLSVENLQALIIIAFNDIGSGRASKAWSIVGSLTRTVEYLQLSIEFDDHEQQQPLLKPLSSLNETRNWTEAEERRRVFWVIFLLDRFCSVTTGWNTSLTSDDVHRRLPCDGGIWAKEEPVTTPFFGIWDKSAARIGNSIAYIPAHYPSPEHHPHHEHGSYRTPRPTTSSGAGVSGNAIDISTLGAFAYCIEATESLSQVTTFFLQQRVNFQDRQEVGSWLTRFKELDLRLVHWKMFLPQKWKDSNISREPALINMDPNLTLAHITHNTSMILLHQRIAYPPSDWSDIVKLPSFWSAETCQLAAVETANISQKYLKYTPPEGIVTSQFTFCVFVSARVLLVHWRYYDAKLFQEFWILIESLEEMSRRWCGRYHSPETQPRHRNLDQAMKYSRQLRDLYRRCLDDVNFRLDVLGYSREAGSTASDQGLQLQPFGDVLDSEESRQTPGGAPLHSQPTNTIKHTSDDATSQSSPDYDNVQDIGPRQDNIVAEHPPSSYLNRQVPFLNKPDAGGNNVAYATMSTPYPSSTALMSAQGPRNQPYDQGTGAAVQYRDDSRNTDNRSNGFPTSEPTNNEDELAMISHTLLGQQFLEMDRVISFDDTTFMLDCMPSAGIGGGPGAPDEGVWVGMPGSQPPTLGNLDGSSVNGM